MQNVLYEPYGPIHHTKRHRALVRLERIQSWLKAARGFQLIEPRWNATSPVLLNLPVSIGRACSEPGYVMRMRVTYSQDVVGSFPLTYLVRPRADI